ncbi:CAP domain-containing protein [Sphingomonas sp. HMP6]|uniref:CAP domain-containing protein n=1 Tax=Sphingomonas sp. HMP6 TaxID=1517551 RepID=UPI0015978A78|nr:CAP domain-containing protein [Sphingomonas sp. HMP6]BCA58870.1 serine protease [Sphingomonas sp. HMP6]
MRFLVLALLLVGCSAGTDDRPSRVVEPRPDAASAARGGALLRRAMLTEHNAARAAVGAPPLVWSDDLARDAARYAAVLATSEQFKHSTEPRGAVPEGENLFMGSRGAYRYDEMARLWVEERRFYRAGAVPDISTTGRWQDVGHYTQIIWRRTTQVGCALASSRRDDYLVCRYTPPGNVVGRRVED